MADLVAIVYSDEVTATRAREQLFDLQSRYLVEITDAVVVTKDHDGKIHLRQPVNMAAAGAVSGGLWGGLIGLLFLNPLLGLAVGAGIGAITGKLSDYGINDDQMREAADNFRPGTSALFILFRKVTADKVVPELAKFGGIVLQSSLSHEEESRLREALARGITPHDEPAPPSEAPSA